MTQTTKYSANPDGTVTLEESSDPVRTEVGDQWTSIDTDLAVGTDGLLAPSAAAVPVEFSDGGSTTIARVQSDSGKWLSQTWPYGALPAPTVDGSTATYGEVLPGVDLRVAAANTGMTEVLIVKDAA